MFGGKLWLMCFVSCVLLKRNEQEWHPFKLQLLRDRIECCGSV